MAIAAHRRCASTPATPTLHSPDLDPFATQVTRHVLLTYVTAPLPPGPALTCHRPQPLYLHHRCHEKEAGRITPDWTCPNGQKPVHCHPAYLSSTDSRPRHGDEGTTHPRIHCSGLRSGSRSGYRPAQLTGASCPPSLPVARGGTVDHAHHTDPHLITHPPPNNTFGHRLASTAHQRPRSRRP